MRKQLNRFNSLIVAIVLLISSFNASAMQKNTAIALDMDDVMSIKEKVGALDFIPLVRAIFWNPWILSALYNIQDLQKQGTELTKTMNGSGNIIHAMMAKLKDQGYGDLSGYELEIIDRATKPKPINEMVELVKNLKKDGYILIGATNQDLLQHQAYRKKMKEQGADLNELFDLVVVTGVDHMKVPAVFKKTVDQNGYYSPVPDENIAVVVPSQVFKPNTQYFKAVEKAAKNAGKKKDVTIEKIVFTDDKKENVEGARKVGIDGYHFELPGGSARKTSPEDLHNTVKGFKDYLKSKNVSL